MLYVYFRRVLHVCASINILLFCAPTTNSPPSSMYLVWLGGLPLGLACHLGHFLPAFFGFWSKKISLTTMRAFCSSFCLRLDFWSRPPPLPAVRAGETACCMFGYFEIQPPMSWEQADRSLRRQGAAAVVLRHVDGSSKALNRHSGSRSGYIQEVGKLGESICGHRRDSCESNPSQNLFGTIDSVNVSLEDVPRRAMGGLHPRKIMYGLEQNRLSTSGDRVQCSADFAVVSREVGLHHRDLKPHNFIRRSYAESFGRSVSCYDHRHSSALPKDIPRKITRPSTAPGRSRGNYRLCDGKGGGNKSAVSHSHYLLSLRQGHQQHENKLGRAKTFSPKIVASEPKSKMSKPIEYESKNFNIDAWKQILAHGTRMRYRRYLGYSG